MISIRAALAFALLAAATPAGAQPVGAQAEVLFREGRDLMAAGKIAEACAAFEHSQELDPAVTTLINLAACREKLGQLATAWGLFLDVERRTRSASDRATAQLHKVALERAARLDPRVLKLTISVPDRSRIDQLEILRDGELVPAVMWNRALPVDGGTYTITARAPGASEWSTRVTLAPEADARAIDVPDLRNLSRDLDEPQAPARPAQPGAPEAPGAPPRGLALPLTIGAGAAVLLGGALGFSLWGDSTYDRAKAEQADQARRDALYASANRKRHVAQGLAAAGVGGAGVAIWLYLRRRGAPAGATSARAGHLTLAPTASGLGVAGRF